MKINKIKLRSGATSLFDVRRWTFDVGRSSFKTTPYGINATYEHFEYGVNHGKLPLWLLAGFLLLAIPLSRIYLGAHFPTDLLGGYALVGLWGGLGAPWLFVRLRLAEKKP